jgi:hypothetical protein
MHLNGFAYSLLAVEILRNTRSTALGYPSEMGSENTPIDKACAPENPPSRLCSFGSRGTDALKDFVSLSNVRPPVDYSFGVCSRCGFSFQIHTATYGPVLSGLNRPRMVR